MLLEICHLFISFVVYSWGIFHGCCIKDSHGVTSIHFVSYLQDYRISLPRSFNLNILQYYYVTVEVGMLCVD